MIVMIFELQGQLFAINIEYLHEIVKRQKITTVSSSNTYIAGVTDIRGSIYTCVDTNGILFDKRSEWSPNQLFLLTSYNDTLIAFIVDNAKAISTLKEDDLDYSFKSMSPNTVVEAMFKYEDTIVSLVSIHKVYDILSKDIN